MPFRLKNIEATEKGIIIKGAKEISVDYKDIAWVSRFDITSPWFVTIKYQDKHTGEFKKISFMPSERDQRFFADDAMTEFIKKMIISANAKQSKYKQPSQLKNFVLIMILGLPFGLLALYFLKDTFHVF